MCPTIDTSPAASAVSTSASASATDAAADFDRALDVLLAGVQSRSRSG
jgi:hypothetical protein